MLRRARDILNLSPNHSDEEYQIMLEVQRLYQQHIGTGAVVPRVFPPALYRRFVAVREKQHRSAAVPAAAVPAPAPAPAPAPPVPDAVPGPAPPVTSGGDHDAGSSPTAAVPHLPAAAAMAVQEANRLAIDAGQQGMALGQDPLPIYLRYEDPAAKLPAYTPPLNVLDIETWDPVTPDACEFSIERKVLVHEILSYLREVMKYSVIRRINSNGPRSLVMFELLDFVKNFSTKPSYHLLEMVQRRTHYVEALISSSLFPASHRHSMIYMLTRVTDYLQGLYNRIHLNTQRFSARQYIIDIINEQKDALSLWPVFLLRSFSKSEVPQDWVVSQFLRADRRYKRPCSCSHLSHLLRALFFHPDYKAQATDFYSHVRGSNPATKLQPLVAWPVLSQTENFVKDGKPFLPRKLRESLGGYDGEPVDFLTSCGEFLPPIHPSTLKDNPGAVHAFAELVFTCLGHIVNGARLISVFNCLERYTQHLGQFQLFIKHRALLNELLQAQFDNLRSLREARTRIDTALRDMRKMDIRIDGGQNLKPSLGNISLVRSSTLSTLHYRAVLCEQATHQLYAEANALSCDQLRALGKQVEKDFWTTQLSVLFQLKTDLGGAWLRLPRSKDEYTVPNLPLPIFSEQKFKNIAAEYRRSSNDEMATRPALTAERKRAIMSCITRDAPEELELQLRQLAHIEVNLVGSMTILHVAALRRKVKCVTMLLGRAPPHSVNVLDKNGYTPLTSICANVHGCNDMDYYLCIARILQACQDQEVTPAILNHTADAEGNLTQQAPTAFHQALYNDAFDICELLALFCPGFLRSIEEGEAPLDMNQMSDDAHTFCGELPQKLRNALALHQRAD